MRMIQAAGDINTCAKWFGLVFSLSVFTFAMGAQAQELQSWRCEARQVTGNVAYVYRQSYDFDGDQLNAYSSDDPATAGAEYIDVLPTHLTYARPDQAKIEAGKFYYELQLNGDGLKTSEGATELQLQTPIENNDHTTAVFSRNGVEFRRIDDDSLDDFTFDLASSDKPFEPFHVDVYMDDLLYVSADFDFVAEAATAAAQMHRTLTMGLMPRPATPDKVRTLRNPNCTQDKPDDSGFLF